MNCPHCGTEYTQGELFCTECGAQLATAEDATTIVGTQEKTGIAAGLVPGTTLQNGRYVITKLLGEGGMGSVMLAKDTRLADKLMVIKVLSADTTNTQKLQEDVRNFKREAETLAHLDHPLVPDVTDHFEEGMNYYMVMDYVAGENLEDWLKRTRHPMEEQDALRYALEVLDILEYLSKQQPAIVHRDIKPANIIIGAKDQHAHLVDFGIARANTIINGKLRKTTALGTPGYAPPEQYQGYADPRSDLYALAATLHHLVTNRDPGDYPPFQYPPAKTLNSSISPRFEQILEKALNTDANQRYQTARDMKQDIELLLTGTSALSMTDGYRLNDSATFRVLRPQQPDHTSKASTSSAADPFTASTGQTTSRTRQRQQQQQQMQEPSYYDPNYYQSAQQPPPQPRSFYAPPPQPLRSYPPRQQNTYNYRNNQTPISDNQLMWRFILFIVAICMIGLLAYVLFNSLRFY